LNYTRSESYYSTIRDRFQVAPDKNRMGIAGRLPGTDTLEETLPEHGKHQPMFGTLVMEIDTAKGVG